MTCILIQKIYISLDNLFKYIVCFMNGKQYIRRSNIINIYNTQEKHKYTDRIRYYTLFS